MNVEAFNRILQEHYVKPMRFHFETNFRYGPVSDDIMPKRRKRRKRA